MRDTRPTTSEMLLPQLPLFSVLNPTEASYLIAYTRQLQALKGDRLFRKGDACSGLHFVVYGQVKLAITSAGGTEKVMAIVGPGDSIGNDALCSDKPYMTDGQVLTDTLLLHVGKTAILDVMERNPGLARRMLAEMSRRLHELVSDVESITFQSAKQRIIGYLARAQGEGTTDDGATITLEAAKGVIASRLNLTQEHFSRTLHELSNQGLIMVDGRRINIPSLSALRLHAA